jgi:uncharacterized protein YuzE
MKIEYDRYAKALYIRLQGKERGRTIEMNENLNIDLDEKGNLLGVEILNPDDYPLEMILKPVVEEYTEKDAESIEIKYLNSNPKLYTRISVVVYQLFLESTLVF